VAGRTTQNHDAHCSWPAILVVIADIVHLTNASTIPPSFISLPTIGSRGNGMGVGIAQKGFQGH